MEDIRALIREVLSEEISAIRSGLRSGVTRETVRISTDSELMAFVRRVLVLAQDPVRRSEIENGQLVFALASGHSAEAARQTAAPHPAPSGAAKVSARQLLDKKLLQEKDIDMLPEGTAVLTLGKSTRLTPLASDELRRRNIKIERIQQ